LDLVEEYAVNPKVDGAFAQLDIELMARRAIVAEPIVLTAERVVRPRAYCGNIAIIPDAFGLVENW